MASPELVIGIVALVLSAINFLGMFALGLLQYRHAASPRLSVTCAWSYPAFPGRGLGPPHISISATNNRALLATITSWGFTWPKGRGKRLVFPRQEDDFGRPLGEIPLEPGATAQRAFAARGVLSRAHEDGVALPFKVRAWVSTADGKTFLSKPFKVYNVPGS